MMANHYLRNFTKSLLLTILAVIVMQVQVSLMSGKSRIPWSGKILTNHVLKVTKEVNFIQRLQRQPFNYWS